MTSRKGKCSCFCEGENGGGNRGFFFFFCLDKPCIMSGL